MQASSLANTLYQGCRSASKDQHYGTEFAALSAEDDKVLEYRVAASRDGPPGVKRTYVQDLIADDSERIWELVGTRSAWIYISGYAFKIGPLSEPFQVADVNFPGRRIRCRRLCAQPLRAP